LFDTFNPAAAPSPLTDPDVYDGSSELSVVCTQTALTSREQSKLVDRWCEALPTFTAVKRLHFFSKVPQRLFDAACEMRELDSMFIKWSGIKQLDAVAQLQQLRSLHLGSSGQVEFLEPLPSLVDLEVLELEGLTRISDLSPLSRLVRLRSLKLAGGFSTDWCIDSLEPLSSLTSLEHLALAALKVKDESLAPVSGLRNLKELRISNYFPVEQYALLAAKLPDVTPAITAIYARTTNNLKCSRCGGGTMRLPTGKGARWLCAECDAAKVAKKTTDLDKVVRRHA